LMVGGLIFDFSMHTLLLDSPGLFGRKL